MSNRLDKIADGNFDYWIWQGDGEDRLESLVCPVLIEADDLRAMSLTPEEAKELMYCWIHESQRRYGKVNREAPLYLKLKEIARPVLLVLKAQCIEGEVIKESE